MNPHASALGKQAKGVKKTMTPEAIAARQENLVAARKKRWPAKKRRKPNTVLSGNGGACQMKAKQVEAFTYAASEP